MSLPVENARTVAQSMRAPAIRKLIAQSKAKQVLREVREAPANFPNFEPDLDDRVTFVSYGLLAAGCSLIERDQIQEGHAILQSAAEILESAHRTEARSNQSSALHSLVGAMAFYACGQYSRAFVLIGNIETVTPCAGVIASFLRKDRAALIRRLNNVLLADPPTFENTRLFDDWALTTCMARAVALVSEHAISGHSALLDNADAVLRDAMVISEASSDPASWWLARLLRLMFRDYAIGSLWTALPPFFGPDGRGAVDTYVKLLAFQKPPVVELWRSQHAALKQALDPENKGAVINLRTSAGKTRVAELAILSTLKANLNAKVLYLAPFRSLAFELERTFSKTLQPLGYTVSHLYGGSRFSGIDRELFVDGRITIATPEKTKAMLRASPDLFDDVKLIVIDEGHLLGGNERNVRNEVFLEHLRLLSRQRGARMLLLSAVLPNAEDLAAWVGDGADVLVKSNWKPSGERFGLLRWKASGVSIEWLGGTRCFNPHFIEFKQVPRLTATGNVKSRTFPANKTEAVAATAVRLAELGPVLIFAGQARWVLSMATAVLTALGQDAPPHPWPPTEWRLFEAVCKEELGEDSFELNAARKGVVCHSNKLTPQVRIAIEKLMAKCTPRIIVATTTLGQGVNIGISSVIVATTSIGNEQISKRDFWNICGRAGRAFVDGEGKVLFAIDATRLAWQVRKAEESAKVYFDMAHLDRVESGVLQVVRLLLLVAKSVGVSFEVLLELAANDKFDRCGKEQADVEALVDWIDDQLLALHVAYKGNDITQEADWVDDAFRGSLAAIQARANPEQVDDGQLLGFLRARAIGVLRKVPSAEGRRAIVASGLPLSVGIAAFSQLDRFRKMVDRYLGSEQGAEALGKLVSEIEEWGRAHGGPIVEGIPEKKVLDKIRPQWLAGESLKKIAESCGAESPATCTEFYGYQLPWLFHSIAQKLDREEEEDRNAALAKAGLLVELGLPSEVACKVFLAGVRSRAAAVELSQYVVDSGASVSKIRGALLDEATVEKLSALVSAPTLEWLHLLSVERGERTSTPPRCSNFDLQSKEDVALLHARRGPQGSTFLCSTDGRIKYAVKSTEDLPFDKLVDDPRFAFSKEGNVWVQQYRDPRVPPPFDALANIW